MTTVTVTVFLYIISNVLLFTTSEVTNLYKENCFNFTTVTETVAITDQRRLNEFIQDSIFSNSSSNVSKCVQLSFTGKSFQLDLLQLMSINLGTNGGLMLTGNSVILNCIVNTTDLEELRKLLQPISRTLLVLFDGLVFTRCLAPILMEEVTNVIIQNCVFM